MVEAWIFFVELEKLFVHECIEYDLASIVEILVLTNGILNSFTLTTEWDPYMLYNLPLWSNYES
jgi:hypothetical protein